MTNKINRSYACQSKNVQILEKVHLVEFFSVLQRI